MTDLADRTATASPFTPPAARLSTRRRPDLRLVVGIVLICASILLGARLLSTSARTTGYLAAARPLSAGHVLSAGDLAVVQARLPASSTTLYWSAASSAGLLGRTLTGPVAAGALVPRDDISAPGAVPQREVSLPVDPTRLAAVVPGDLVDVFATYHNGGSGGLTVAVVRGASYLGTSGSSISGELAVQLEVPVADAGPLVHASELGSLDVVREDPSGRDFGNVGSAPITGDLPAAP